MNETAVCPLAPTSNANTASVLDVSAREKDQRIAKLQADLATAEWLLQKGFHAVNSYDEFEAEVKTFLTRNQAAPASAKEE